MDNNWLTEEVLSAMKIIADGTIKNQGYDKTELCQIIKILDKKIGKYEVLASDQLTYEVWSIGKNEYFVNDWVYVIIPQNAVENKKFILGDKSGIEILSEGEISYDNFFSMLNFSSNKEEKLIINEKGKTEEKKRTGVILWEQDNLNIKGYQFLGIKLDFQSLLQEINITKGNYGIKISLYYSDGQNKDNQEIRELIFDSSEFIGNSYSYLNFVTQKKVFNVSHLKPIRKIIIEFYQSNNFYNAQNEYLNKQNNYNLRVKNLSLDFGINIETVKNDSLFLNCDEDIYYKAPKSSLNNKKIILSWLHRNEEDIVNKINFQTPEKMLEKDYDYYKNSILKWYRYTPDNNNDDGIGKFWNLISEYFFDLSTSTYYKIESNYDTIQKEIKNNIIEITEENINFNKTLQGYKIGDSLYQSDKKTLINFPIENYLFIPDLNQAQEKIKVVLYHYNDNGVIDNVKESNIIEFYNEDQNLVKKANKVLTAFNLQCEDNSDGNYFLYDLSNNILNASESLKNRQLICYFNENNTNLKIKEAQKVQWFIPRKDSMLLFDDFYSYSYYNSIEEGIKKQKIGSIFGIINNKTKIVDKYCKIIDTNRVEELDFQNPLKIDSQNSNEQFLCLYDNTNSSFSLDYRISNNLLNNLSNNSITSVIEINDIEYIAKKDFVFGVQGTSGSKTTLMLSFVNKNYICYEERKQNDEDNFVIIEAHLYDGNNNEIIDLSSATFEFEWYEPSLDSYCITLTEGKPNKIYQKGLVISEGGKKNQIIIKMDKEKNIDVEQFLNSFNVLQCTVKGIEKFNLVNWQPIAKCNRAALENGWQSFQGVTKIISDSSGEFSFFKNPYNIIKNNNDVDKNLFWRINNETKKYSASIPLGKEEEKLINNKNWYYKDENKNNYYFLNNVTTDFLKGNNKIQLYYNKIDFNFPKISHDPLYKKINLLNKDYKPNLNHGYIIKFLGENEIAAVLNKNQYTEQDFYQYFNNSEKIIESIEEVFPLEDIEWNLEIKDFYYENTPLFGIQAYKEKKDIVISNDLNIYAEDIDYSEAVWNCPILVLNNPYFSQVINEWDGQTLGIDEENGILLSKMLSAGSKNEENKFSGVILGDWSNSNSEKSITKNTGLYGFHEGIMSFYFKDDGTAAIGKRGIGQLQFNGNSGIIQSGLYDLSEGKKGACLDFVNGKIMLMNDTIGNVIFDSSQNSQVEVEILDEILGLKGIVASLDGITPLENIHLILENGKYYQIKYIELNGRYTGEFDYIYDEKGKKVKGQPIQSGGFPIVAGNNFKVGWDGTVYANNGNFTGIIHATGGTITGNMKVDGILSGATIESGKFNAKFSLGNNILQKSYNLVTVFPENEPYNTKISDDLLKFYKKENNLFVSLSSEEDKKEAFNNGILYELIINYIPGIEEANDTQGYFPINFNMVTGNGEELEELAQIGIIRAKTSENPNVSNVLGLKTKVINTNDQSQNLSIGFDSGTTLRAHAKTYSGLSVGDNGFNNAEAQVAVQKVDGKFEFIVKGIDLIQFAYSNGNTIDLEKLEERIKVLESKNNNNNNNNGNGSPALPPSIIM